MKQIFITTDELSKCNALAEILGAVFPECEIKVVVSERLETGYEKKTCGLPASIHSH